MKVLLLGDFSSFHKFLKDGLLKSKDVEVTLVSNGDGFKKIGGADLTFPIEKGKGLFSKAAYYFRYLRFINTFKGYDVVQIMNPSFTSYVIGKKVIDTLKKNNKKLFLIGAGIDYGLVSAYKEGRFDYSVFDLVPECMERYDETKLLGKVNADYERYIANSANAIIPMLYEYSLGYKSNNVTKVIPVAINVESFEYSPNIVGKRVVFFHGLNDERKKGTFFIREALSKISNDYPEDVEVYIDGHMPFSDYVKVLSKANVVIDQCTSYGYGINACISMAQGKVVMAGARPETLKAFGIDKCPIVDIRPDVNYIYKQLEYIIKNKNRIPEWGGQSRKYVETVHDMNKVAEEYIKVWTVNQYEY